MPLCMHRAYNYHFMVSYCVLLCLLWFIFFNHIRHIRAYKFIFTTEFTEVHGGFPYYLWLSVLICGGFF